MLSEKDFKFQINKHKYYSKLYLIYVKDYTRGSSQYKMYYQKHLEEIEKLDKLKQEYPEYLI